MVILCVLAMATAIFIGMECVQGGNANAKAIGGIIGYLVFLFGSFGLSYLFDINLLKIMAFAGMIPIAIVVLAIFA